MNLPLCMGSFHGSLHTVGKDGNQHGAAQQHHRRALIVRCDSFQLRLALISPCASNSVSRVSLAWAAGARDARWTESIAICKTRAAIKRSGGRR